MSYQQYEPSLTDHFAIRAPLEPQKWFVPVIGPRPALPDFSSLTREESDEVKAALDVDDEAHLTSRRARDFYAAYAEAHQAGKAWDQEFEKQRLIQWPYAWAKAVVRQEYPR